MNDVGHVAEEAELDPGIEFRRLASQIGGMRAELETNAAVTDKFGAKLDDVIKQLALIAKMPAVAMSPATYAAKVDTEVGRRLTPALDRLTAAQNAMGVASDRASAAVARAHDRALYAMIAAGIVALMGAVAGWKAVIAVPTAPEKIICEVHAVAGPAGAAPGPASPGSSPYVDVFSHKPNGKGR